LPAANQPAAGRERNRRTTVVNTPSGIGTDTHAAARALLSKCEVWDITLPWIPMYWDMHVLARYRGAGFTFVSATLQDWPPTFEGTRACIERFRRLMEPLSSWLMFGHSLSEIDAGRKAGKLVLGLNSQETRLIGEDISRIAVLHELGFRHMLLAYNVRNFVADGCAEPSDAGLSNFGRAVVREMNHVGIIVDCSHTGRRSSLEAIEMSTRPAIFSHSNAYSVCPHIRNITDDQITACAARDGVIGVVGVGAFLGDAHARSETMFRHIDYIATLVGPRHVGLGTDYVSIFPARDHAAKWAAIPESEKSWPQEAFGWPDPTGTQIPLEDSHCFRPEQLVELVDLMMSHGYAEDDIRGILGSNFRRVYATAE
jgi:membrane dipeptidase